MSVIKEKNQEIKSLVKTAFIKAQLDYIIACQNQDGGIQESPGSFIDPWNHIESCLALLSYNYIDQARLGLRWLIEIQNSDGSWFTRYLSSKKPELNYQHTQSHYAAYIAILIWYDFFVTGDLNELKKNYPILKNALDFTLSCQSKEGLFYWAKTIQKQCDETVLLTANANIYNSLMTAYSVSKQLNAIEKTRYLATLKKHKVALLQYYKQFQDFKLDFSMDWFYPVLCGLLRKSDAKQHLEMFWEDFVEDELGCLCRKNKPWVTFAESSELIMALCIAKQTHKAKKLFDWIIQKPDQDHLFWMGYEHQERCFWPLEKPSWTSAAILLALKHLSNPKQACFIQLIDQFESDQ